MPVAERIEIPLERQLRAACLELERRLSGGEACSAEQLLALYPELQDDADSALELIFAEFTLRRQRGEKTSHDDWYQRFPQWRARLERLFHVYEAIGAEASLATGVAGNTVRPGDPLTAGLGPESTAGQASSGARRIGSYELLDEIARGGMGVVYKARHLVLNRIVALKLILAGEHAGAEQRARFYREAEAAARLQHPSIVQIFEIGQQGNLPFLAMEYIEGWRLDELLSRRRLEGSVGLPAREAADLIESLARAIQHAHEHGVVHRDLKPANVLLSVVSSHLSFERAEGQMTNDQGRMTIPKITDFGLAKTLGESQAETRTGMLLGTPSYMAPEQAAGRPADIGPATDIFALGVMLYEMVTGNLPFQGTSIEETLAQVRSVEPIPPSQLQRNLPRDLQTICLKCLQKEPARRYASAAALAEDLRRFSHDEPILARPVGRTERVVRWCRRNPAVASLTGGIALVLVCGTVISTSLAVWALREKSLAAVNAGQALENAEQERQARELADRRFEQAEKAVEEYLDGIEKNERLKESDFFDLRKQLLTSAVPFYDDFVKAKPGDAKLEAKRAQAYFRLGMLRDELGEHEQSLADFRQMRNTYQQLADGFPGVPDYRHQLAISYHKIAFQLRDLGSRAEAALAYSQALDLLKRLTAEFPAASEYQEERAVAHNGLGALLSDVGKHAEAEAELLQSIDLDQQLVKEFPSVPRFREHLAKGHYRLAFLFEKIGRWPEAEAALRQVVDVCKELDENFPSADHRAELAQAHNGLSVVLRDQGKEVEAEVQLREALALRQPLAEAYPSVPEHRATLWNSHHNLAVLLSDQGNPLKAASEFEKAIEIMQRLMADFPTIPRYRHNLALSYHASARALEQIGMAKEAKAEYRKALEVKLPLVEQQPEVQIYRSSLAATLSGLAGALKKEGDLDEARRLYEQCIEHARAVSDVAPIHSQYGPLLRDAYHRLGDITLAQKDHRATADAARHLAAVRADSASDAQFTARFLGRCVVLANQDTKLAEAERQALAQSYADEAMKYLHEAVRRGFTDAKALKSLAALVPLRERPDFQQLVRELEER